MGSNPLFGYGFLNMKPLVVKNYPAEENNMRSLLERVMTPQSRQASPVTVVDVVVKQMRTTPNGETEVNLSSIKVLVSNIAKERMPTSMLF
ncbi:hypothetical protein AGDE_13195 [Angomonas deanei]|nr:hypothetical protein AGDE_13195 [Angomonas deanei]|eukprot:EPY22564.1 hypothetical protein AGDE_13195 [Angomonas deanei]